jgi:hypothetical protein
VAASPRSVPAAEPHWPIVDRGVQMRLRKRAVAAVFVTTAAFTAIAPQAMAVPMPWETSKTPAATTHGTNPTATGEHGTATVLCTGGCYQ